MDINEDAPVITRDEIFIEAPIETIWEIQTNVADWRVAALDEKQHPSERY